MVGYDRRRRQVELLHTQMKSRGIDVERLPMQSVEALAKAIAANCIAVWRMVHLTYQARETPDAPATE